MIQSNNANALKLQQGRGQQEINENCHSCTPIIGWPCEAYALLGRHDMAATLYSAHTPPQASCTPPAAPPDTPAPSLFGRQRTSAGEASASSFRQPQLRTPLTGMQCRQDVQVCHCSVLKMCTGLGCVRSELYSLCTTYCTTVLMYYLDVRKGRACKPSLTADVGPVHYVQSTGK